MPDHPVINDLDYPVITIDGPAASGKGTLARRLSAELRFNLLDSGLLYRIVGYTASRHGIDPRNANQIDTFLRDRVTFKINERPSTAFESGSFEVYIFKTVGVEDIVSINGQNVNLELRSRDTGVTSSIVSSIPEVREQLIPIQRAMLTKPGLIADGRDMGTVVFPDASLKFFLEASVEIRARRRLAELDSPLDQASVDTMKRELEERDQRDRTRTVAPLTPAEDARTIDTTCLDIDGMYAVAKETVRAVLGK